MEINLLGVPLFYGCDNPGVENGPNSLRKSDVIGIFKENNNKVFDLGNLYINKVDNSCKYKNHNKMKYLSQITEVNENLAQWVYTSLKANTFPFIIGGDHSLGLGSLAGASRVYGDDLGVIWVDAHGDINTFNTSPSGNIHGMPLAASMGVGHESLTNLYFEGRKINPKKVFILCARDLDKGELDLIDSLGLNVWTASAIKAKGLTTIIEELLDIIKDLNISNLHLSFDIDCLDSSLVPGTGTPVADGISLTDAKYILNKLFNTHKIKSMDFVEFNPKIEHNITLDTCLDLIKCISQCI